MDWVWGYPTDFHSCGEKSTVFLHSYEIKSGSGLGMSLVPRSPPFYLLFAFTGDSCVLLWTQTGEARERGYPLPPPPHTHCSSPSTYPSYCLPSLPLLLQFCLLSSYAHTHTHTHTHYSHIPQMEQQGPEGRMLFHLGNVTYLLDVTPSNPLPHPLSPSPILLCVI